MLCFWYEQDYYNIDSVLVVNEDIDIGSSDIPAINNFQSSERQIDIIAYYLNEWLGIRL